MVKVGSPAARKIPKRASTIKEATASNSHIEKRIQRPRRSDGGKKSNSDWNASTWGAGVFREALQALRRCGFFWRELGRGRSCRRGFSGGSSRAGPHRFRCARFLNFARATTGDGSAGSTGRGFGFRGTIGILAGVFAGHGNGWLNSRFRGRFTRDRFHGRGSIRVRGGLGRMVFQRQTSFDRSWGFFPRQFRRLFRHRFRRRVGTYVGCSGAGIGAGPVVPIGPGSNCGADIVFP